MSATDEPGLDGVLVAGVDVGGTKTSVVVTDDRDRVLYEHVAPTDRSSLVDQIAGLVDDAGRQLGQDIAAVGVAIPGHVDPGDGSVRMAVNLGITHLPLGPMLQTELGVPIFVEHDARAAALWLSEQAADGSAQAPASIAFLAIGTGHLGRHRSRRGRCSAATTALPARWATSSPIRKASCARVVCAAASRRSPPVPGIARQADEAIAAGRSTVLSPHPSAGDVFRAASAGDEVALEITDRVADHLTRAIRSLALTTRRQADRHRRRRGGGRTRPSRTYPIAHPPRMRGLAAGPGHPGRREHRAAVADRGARRARGGSDRSTPNRLA